MKLSNILLVLVCCAFPAIMGITFYQQRMALNEGPVALSAAEIAAEKRVALSDMRSLHAKTQAFPKEPPMQLYTQFYKEVYSQANTRPYYFKYYVYAPRGYDPNKRYPLVLLLHGASRHMYGGAYILDPSVQKNNTSFVVVPIAPEGMQWGVVNPRLPLNDANPLAMEAVQQVMRQYPIDKERVYVSGYSMGGTGTYAMVEQYPDFFAGALVLCGTWLPDHARNFPNDVNILAVHGSADKPELAHSIVNALKAADKPIYYREYPGVGHDIWNVAYRDPKVWAYLFSLRRKE